MAKERISMRKIREVLRLRWEIKLKYYEIARSCNIGRSTVGEYLFRAENAGLKWPLPESLDDSTLEHLLYPPQPDKSIDRAVPDWEQVHKDIRRKSVTLCLLWQEYKETCPDGYEYSWFCRNYRTWSGRLDLVMRQHHNAGEKLFVDYAGQTMPVINKRTGEIIEAQIFVATMGASNYTYAEATWTQSLPDWIGSHTRAFLFFGGVPELIIPDNLKTGVNKACRYEPDLNPTYQNMAEHYECAVIPARIKKPKDKGKVEKGVQTVEQWILARLRNQTFFSLTELNQVISRLLVDLNDRPFQKMSGSRKSLFEELDRPALKPLPVESYVYAEWKKARPHVDYHIEVEGFYYSVPYQLVKKELDVRITQQTIEVFYKRNRVSSHPRNYDRSLRHVTTREHMPKSHQKYAEWTPDRIIKWAAKTGQQTARMVEAIMASRSHPQQGFRACMGIMSLGKEYGKERLEAACSRALDIGSPSYKSVQSILKNNLDMRPLQQKLQQTSFITHSNIRGPEYYKNTKGGNDYADTPNY